MNINLLIAAAAVGTILLVAINVLLQYGQALCN